MEGVQYEHAIGDAHVRLHRLRQACMAFFAEPSTRQQIHMVALLVDVPTLADSVVATTAVAAAASPGAPPPAKEKPARKQSTQSPAAAAKREAAQRRRQQHAQAALQCARQTNHRLAQAKEDAKALQAWLSMYYYYSSPSAADFHRTKRDTAASLSNRVDRSHSPVTVVVVAQLQPHAVEDLLLYRAWQCHISARHGSPLRHADVLSISFGSSPALVVNWVESPPAVLLKRGRWNLVELLLSHQSLMLDLTWCVHDVAVGNRVGSGGRGAWEDRRSRGEVHRLQEGDTAQRAFLTEMQRQLVLPKGRAALMVRYFAFLSACFDRPAAAAADEFDGPTEPRNRGLSELCAHFSSLYRQLYDATAGGLGATSGTRLVCPYGGPVETLVATSLPQIAVPAPPSVGSSGAWDSVSLLLTRAPRDVYALVGMLVGHDRVDLYTEAVAFIHGVRSRSHAANALRLSSFTPLTAAMNGDDTAAATAVVAVAIERCGAAAEAFVRQGKRTIARQRASLAAKRPRPGAHGKEEKHGGRKRRGGGADGEAKTERHRAAKRLRKEGRPHLTAVAPAEPLAPLTWEASV